MDHLTLKAVTTTTTEQGAFEAVISTESIDREKDIVSAAGMVDALRKWNRPIPLAWNHSTKAEDIFGHIDPQTVREVGGEVVAGGQVDLESTVGKEAWRSFKARTLGFSFGYLILTATKRKGGGRHITTLDVFEVTATPTPMNNDTRVLSTKAAGKQLASVTSDLLQSAGRERFGAGPAGANGSQDQFVYVDDFDPDSAWVVYCVGSDTTETQYLRLTYTLDADGEIVLSDTEVEVTRTTAYQPKGALALRAEAARVAREAEAERLPVVPAADPAPKTDLARELQEVKARLAKSETDLEDLKKKAEATDREPRARSVDPLRKQAEAVALENASGGESLRKPPPKTTPEPPELVPLGDLKRQMRDQMLARLSEGIPS